MLHHVPAARLAGTQYHICSCLAALLVLHRIICLAKQRNMHLTLI